MSELSEDEAINVFLKNLVPYYIRVFKGFLDDSSLIDVKGSKVFFKIDGTSLKSSLYPWMGLDDLAFRVCAGAVTDVIAKGGKPVSIAISLGLPRSISAEDIESLGRGVAEFLGRYSLTYAGGDMNSAVSDGWIDVAVLGIGSRFIPNGPWRVNERVYVSGCLGLSSIPALILYGGHDSSYLSDDLIAKLRRPKIPLNFLGMANHVHSSTDISDGLRSLKRVLELSNVALRLTDDLPLCNEVKHFIRDAGLNVNEVLKYLGEEYVIAYTGSANNGLLLGEVVDGEPGAIIYRGERIAGGWDNFKGFID